MVARSRMRRSSRQTKLKRRTRRMKPQKIMEDFGKIWDEVLSKTGETIGKKK